MSGAWPADVTLKPDGTIAVDGNVFTSPSGASDYVTGGSTNGWDFWTSRQNDGKSTPLSEYREQAIARIEESAK